MRVCRQHKPTCDVRGEAAQKAPQKFNGLDPTESEDKFSSSQVGAKLVRVRRHASLWWGAASGAMAPHSYRAMMSTTALLVAAVAGSPIDDSALGLCEVAWHTEPSHVSCIQFAQACTMQHHCGTVGNWPLAA
jgi:hypothetical protein